MRLERLCELLKDAASRGAKWVTFPELTLTTFFPRWSMDDPQEGFPCDRPTQVDIVLRDGDTNDKQERRRQ